MEENFKDIVANNLILYRKERKLTQAELAEKLNYSDKSISKWERGESLPDLEIMKKLADLYGIKVDDFFSHKNVKTVKKNRSNLKHLIISILSILLVWLVAIICFVCLHIFLPSYTNGWLFFIYSIPASCIVALVFSCIWGKRCITASICTLLVWTLLLSIYLSIDAVNLWTIFLIAIPIQIAIVLWFFLKKMK
mgnify:CR=1 FL=1